MRTSDPLADAERGYRAELISRCLRQQLSELFGAELHLRKLSLQSLFVRMKLRQPTLTSEPLEVIIPSDITSRLTSVQQRQLLEVVIGRLPSDTLGRLDPSLREDIDAWLKNFRPGETFDIAAALRRFRVIAIAGPGGSGKTTLLRWLALVCAEGRQTEMLGEGFDGDCLPVLIDLAPFSQWLRENGDMLKLSSHVELLGRYAAHTAGRDPGLTEFLSSALQRRAALILADGFDEILEPRDRHDVRAFLQALMRIETDSRVRLIVSSRPEALPPGSFGPEIADLTLLPFGRDEIRSYLTRHWYPAVYGSSFLDEARALAQQIEDSPELAQLADRPLICTLLAVLFHRGLCPLPRRRVVVLTQCCDLLLHRWDDSRDLIWPGDCGPDTKLALAAQLAFAALAESPNLVLPSQRVQEIARAYLRKALVCSDAVADQTAQGLLKTIQRRAGLLERRSDGAYQFLARPFVDFLAAHCVARMPDPLPAIESHLFNTQWRDTLVMAFGALTLREGGGAVAAQAIIALLDATAPPPGFGAPVLHGLASGLWRNRWLESHLFRVEDLLAEAMAETAVDRAVAPALRPALRALVQRCGLHVRRRRAGTAVAAIKALGRLAHMDSQAEGIVIEALHQSPTHLGRAAIEALSRPGISDHALDALVRSGTNPKGVLHETVIRAVGRIGRPSPAVFSLLNTGIANVTTQVEAFEALTAIGSLHPQATALAARLVQARYPTKGGWWDPKTRAAAARALALADPRTSDLTELLLASCDDGDSELRRVATRSLARLAGAHPAILDEVIAVIDNRIDTSDAASIKRRRSLQVLGLVAIESSRALERLTQALSDPLYDIRNAAVQALEGHSSGTPAIAKALSAIASRDEIFTAMRAHSALERMGFILDDETRRRIDEHIRAEISNPSMVSLLAFAGVVAPQTAESLAGMALSGHDFRYAAMRKLGPVAREMPEYQEILVQAVGHWDPSMRHAAADALHTSGRAAPEALPSMLAAVQVEDTAQNVDSSVNSCRAAMIHALKIVAPGDARVFPALLRVLDDPSKDVRRAAAAELCRLEHTTAETQAAFMACLRHHDRRIRETAVGNLLNAHGWNLSERVTMLLDVLRREKENNVRQAVVRALQSRMQEDSGLAEHAMPEIRRMAAGPSKPTQRAHALELVGTDPQRADPLVFNIDLALITAALRSRNAHVATAAHAALIALTRDCAIRSIDGT